MSATRRTRNDVPIDSPPASRAVDNWHKTLSSEELHVFRRVARRLGWSLECWQLQAGTLSVRAMTVGFDGLKMLHCAANRRLELACSGPQDSLTLAVSAGDTGTWVNGYACSGERHVLVPPGACVRALIPESAGVSLVSIPESWVGTLPDELAGLLPSADIGDVLQIEGERDTSAAAIRAVLHCHERGVETMALGELRTALRNLLRRSRPAAANDDVRQRAEVRRTLDQACAYVDLHLCDPIRIGEVCASAGVSLSKLERLFRRRFEMSPSAYIRARRLAKVRTRLQNAAPARGRISSIAKECGFRHLGRFSAAYRAQFGEAPSATACNCR